MYLLITFPFSAPTPLAPSNFDNLAGVLEPILTIKDKKKTSSPKFSIYKIVKVPLTFCLQMFKEKNVH